MILIRTDHPFLRVGRHSLRRCCHRQPPDQGCDHHYYHFHPRRCIIGVSGGGRGWVDCSRSSRSFSAGSLLLTHLLFFSSESLRMIILSSPGGPRTSWLRSPKSFLMNFSSHKMPGMRPSSSEDEDRSTTRTFSEGPPCSNTGEHGQREEISDGDPSGGGDPDGTNGGVEPPLGEEEPSLEGERARLVPLFYSIIG
jgi:hypothetical protein